MDVLSDSMKDTKEDMKRFKKLPFSASERELIVALVRERPIIEDKRTHADNILLKKQAWEDLTVAFNAQPYVSQRISLQLKRCWENIKSQRKKELSQESRSMILTGGGPPQVTNMTLDEHTSTNEAENTSSLKLKRKLTKEIMNTPISEKKLENEMDARKKRCTMNIQHGQVLHELRIQREKILIEREKNLLEYEREIHQLQKEKLQLEIDVLLKIKMN